MIEHKIGDSIVKVDDSDFGFLNWYRWHIKWVNRYQAYVSRSLRVGSRVVSIYLHREIMGVRSGKDVHHVNGDTLDNRRENLRIVPRKHGRNKKTG